MHDIYNKYQFKYTQADANCSGIERACKYVNTHIYKLVYRYTGR